jgi:hypothetical protein
MWSGVFLSCVVGFSDVSAQPSSSGNNPQGTITVTGCLQQGGAGGTIGTTGGVEAVGGASGSGGGQYVLMQATMVPSGRSAASPTGSPAAGDGGNTPSPGRTVSSTGAAGGGKYILDGAKADLQPHIGHQVEIVGRMVAGAVAAEAKTSPTGGRTSTNADASSENRLQVQAVRMTKSDCASR